MKNEHQQAQQSTPDHGETHLLGNKKRRLFLQQRYKPLFLILLYIGLFILLVAIGRSPLAVMTYLIILGVGSLLVERCTATASKEAQAIMWSLFSSLTTFILLTVVSGRPPLIAMITSILIGVMYWFGLRLTTSYQRR